MAALMATGASLAAFAANPAEETNEYWLGREAAALRRIEAQRPNTNRAKNIILYIGDGMGITTITAARIMAGQRLNPAAGEEHELAMDQLPYSALSRTYSVNQQTSDSAPTATAILAGVKTKNKIIGVGPSVVPNDFKTVTAANKIPTILHLAKKLGKAAGVVTTTRVTHATPAACYAHSPDRDWECDADIKGESKSAHEAGFPDIARQLLEFPETNGTPQIDVVLGGGRNKFLPKDPPPGQTNQPNHPKGSRLDQRNLIAEWTNRFERAHYVADRTSLLLTEASEVSHLLGLFNTDNLPYDAERDKAKDPSLMEMTAKALQILQKNPDGFFLMVEGGRIDHGHHAGNAYRALTDAIAFDDAIRYGMEHTNPEETLIIVTADHSHTLTLSGYAQRGNPILGLVRVPQDDGKPGTKNSRDLLGKPFTSLLYANGPGHVGAAIDETDSGDVHVAEGAKFYTHSPDRYRPSVNGRPILTQHTATFTNYLQEAAIPLGGETHGGEDVAILAGGPQAHLIRGVREQNYIFQVMKRAFGAAP